MPQYPMPPWPADQPPIERRSVRLGVNNPRFSQLPVVSAAADGTITVLRGYPTVVHGLLAQADTRPLYEWDTDVDQPHFAVPNRLDQVRFVAAERPVWVDLVEFYEYTATYNPLSALNAASSLEEVRDTLLVEYERAGQFAADGWELTRVHDGPDGLLLVDTRRPDEDLTVHDLP